MTQQKKNFIVLALASLALVLMVAVGLKFTENQIPQAEKQMDKTAILQDIFGTQAIANTTTINEQSYMIIVAPLQFKSDSGSVVEHGIYFLDKTTGILLLYRAEPARGQLYRFVLVSALNVQKEMERAKAKMK